MFADQRRFRPTASLSRCLSNLRFPLLASNAIRLLREAVKNISLYTWSSSCNLIAAQPAKIKVHREVNRSKMFTAALLVFASLVQTHSWYATVADTAQKPLVRGPNGFGHNELFHPTPEHLLPQKKPFHIDESIHWYERYINGSANGAIRRASCPAVNILANRGYINRSGRNVSYSELAHAVRYVHRPLL